MHHTTRHTHLASLVLVAAIVVFGSHVATHQLEGARLDVTETGLYSLTPGTVRILGQMEAEGTQTVEITLYFSESVGKTLPRFIKEFVTYARYVENLLREYERAADGRIEVRIVDPAPDSDAAQAALDAGLDGKPVNQDGDLFFFGLVVETQTGSSEVIDFLWPDQQATVEYEITKRLHQLLWPSGKRVGVLSSLEVLGSADNPYLAQMLAAQGKQPRQKWLVFQLLDELYDVVEVPTDTTEIDPEIDLVVVVHPKELPEPALFALDRWVTAGGNALVLVDPYSIEDRAPQDPQQPWLAFQYEPSSNLEPLFSAWGLERPAHEFAADFELAVRRSVGQRGPAESVIVDLQIGPEQRDETLATDHPILQGIETLRFLLPGALRPSPAVDDGGPTFTPLVTTTGSGSLLEIQPGFGGDETLAFTDLNDAAKLRDRFRPGTEPVVLAALVTGRLGPAYPDGIETGAETEPAPAVVPEEERADATVLVIADVDLLSDQIAFQQNILGLVSATNDNHRLIENAVDYLLGSSDLMQVRARRQIARPFTRFDEIERAAEVETLDQERQIRADIEGFQEELRAKQQELTGQSAALFEKRLQEEVDRLNDRIAEKNRELRDIRRERRAALAGEERAVRAAVMWWMPSLVLLVGVGLAVRRRSRRRDLPRGRE